MTFEFKTEPYDHQRAEFDLSNDMKLRALFWEQGCGKSKPEIDTIASLYEAGEIAGAVIQAPNGVHSNWVHDELPIHLVDRVAEKAKILWWRSSKANTKWFKQEVADFLNYRDGARFLCISYDGLMTKSGVAAVKEFVTKNRTLWLNDESHRIKTPGSKRRMRTRRYGHYSPYRRITTGTLVDDSPFDVYSQIEFLDPDAWAPLGIQDPSSFRTYFGVFQKGIRHLPNGRTQEYETAVDYRNLQDMKQIVDQYGSRLMKDDVLDLPPKVYSKFYFEMSPTQARIYKQLRDEMEAWLPSGQMITADLAITRLLRLQQCTSGYLPADLEDELQPLEEKNPRIQALREVVKDTTGKFIVVGKYNIDIDTVTDTLRADGIKTVVIDGRTSDEDREYAKREFQLGDAQALVMKPMEGLTLHAAETMIFYNNGFHLRPRLQAEDRAHRIGLKHTLRIVDIVAHGTVDEQIIRSLRKKRELAGVVQGDELREWI